MKRSNRLVILVGVLLAVLAFVGMVILLNQKGGSTVGPITPTTKVLVATKDIAIGDAVTPAMVKVTEVDPSAVDGTPLGDPSLLRNQAALVAVPNGAQVNAEVFGTINHKPPSITGQLKAGEKAIAFQVDSVTGIDFLITQGDLVDIVFGTTITVLQPTADSAANPSSPQRFEVVAGLESSRTVKTVLQAKRVLYVSDTKIVQQQAGPTPTPSDAAGAAPPPAIDRVVVVIAGSDTDAELIKFAQNDATVIGPMTVVLRSPKDTAVEKTLGLTIDSLVARYGVPIPDIVRSLKTK
ncbi:MAG: RcpC/CpaB family pilus assembly protein [Chloroflexota bacterium]|nr:RcpC/CpaB family pilus assembly protein [Chloroflexota bacterium]